MMLTPGICRHGPEEGNANGRHVLEFCAFKNLVVSNTVFQHRPCHWFHPAEKDGQGHMMEVNHWFKSCVLDTRVYRKIYLQSDHMLVVSNVRFKLKGRKRRSHYTSD